MVPVTRFDLSGYGESLFSDWCNETSDITAVSKARFDVLVGRTSVEVVLQGRRVSTRQPLRSFIRQPRRRHRVSL